MKIAIVASRFNEELVEKMVADALLTFEEKGVQKESLDIVRVPGAFEIPYACQQLAKKGIYDAILTLGLVIRGETYHFELIAQAVAMGIREVSLKFSLPILFSVLTCYTKEQAIVRIERKIAKENAIATLEMIALSQS